MPVSGPLVIIGETEAGDVCAEVDLFAWASTLYKIEEIDVGAEELKPAL